MKLSKTFILSPVVTLRRTARHASYVSALLVLLVAGAVAPAHAVSTLVTDPSGVLHYTSDTDVNHIDLSVDGGATRRYIPGGSVPNRLGTDGKTTYTIELDPSQRLTPGQHTIKLTLTDHAGDTSDVYTHEVRYVQPVDADYVDAKLATMQQPLSSAGAAAIEANRRGIQSNTQGIANTAAIAGMAPLPAGAANGFTAGISRFNGKQGLAAGFQHQLNANTLLKAAVGTGTGGQTVTTLGVSYTWGGSEHAALAATPGDNRDITALLSQVRTLKTERAQQDAVIANLQSKSTAQEARLKRLESMLAQISQAYPSLAQR